MDDGSGGGQTEQRAARPLQADPRPDEGRRPNQGRRRQALRLLTTSLIKGETMSVEEILKTHPRPPIAELAVLVGCIDECGNCEATCTICADACAAEDDVRNMVRCI